MLKMTQTVKKKGSITFILWGEHFEEATAAIFVTKLRQAGLCVKLVGLAGQRPIGKNGLALYPDITLGEALTMAEQASCVVLPCDASTLKHIESDPRILDFFQKSRGNDAKFVVSTADSIQNTRLEKLLSYDESPSTYGTTADLLMFADSLATGLSNGYGL
ncbi:MAG: hypothetical protein AAF702_25345 [Chloroflexota bacterium]